MSVNYHHNSATSSNVPMTYEHLGQLYVAHPTMNVDPDSVSSEPKLSSKRGRKSKYSEAERDQIRKFKKRNMERKRRAFIAQKMSELHSLSLKVVGEDPTKHQKMERADILSLCHDVMQGVSSVLLDNPKMAEKIRSEVSQQMSSYPQTEFNSVDGYERQCIDDSGASMDDGESIVDVETVDAPWYEVGQMDKENIPPHPLQMTLKRDPLCPSAFRAVKSDGSVWRPYV